jgi:hypothetical protein
MRLDDIRNRIGALDIVRGIPAEVRPRVVLLFLGIGSEQERPDGVVLFERGAANDGSAYILLEGSLEVEKPQTPPIPVEAPHLIGELAQLDKKKQRGATGTVKGGATLLHFTWSAFGEAAQSVLTNAEVQAVRESIENLAWEHFSN